MRLFRWYRIGLGAPLGLLREQAVMYSPELPLRSHAHGCFGRRPRIRVQVIEGEIAVGEPNFPGGDVVAHDFRRVGIVPELACRALEIAGHDQPDFRGRVAHGALSIGYISALLGTKLPGNGSIFLSASIVFKIPVRIGDKVVTTATVREVNGRAVVMDCACTVDGKLVLESEAHVLAPRRPAAGSKD